MEYRYREAWQARPPRQPYTPLRPERVTRLFVHHTTGAQQGDIPAWLRSIQRFHQDSRGWNDIAYCWLVDRDGVIWEGRGNVLGGHTKGYNSTSVAIAYLGDGDGPVPEAALRAIRYQADNLARTFPITQVSGHRDVGATACPGDWLYGWVTAGMLLSNPEPLPVPARPEQPTQVYRPPTPDVRDGWRRHLAWMRSRR